MNATSFALAAIMLAGLSMGGHATVDDFGRARLISIDPAHPVQRLLLPADVYEWSTRVDLGDVRVLNAAGQEMPYVLRQPRSRSESGEAQSLPIFDLPSESAAVAPGAVNIELGAGGTVIAVQGGSSDVTAAKQRRYLFDASGYRGRMSELTFTWPKDTEQFVANVTVEGSDDLTTWRTLVVNATLASLTTDGHQVRVDNVRLREERIRYLRVSQTTGSAPLVLDGVSARGDSVRPQQPDWKVLAGVSVDRGLEFVTDGVYPVDRVALERPGAVFLQEVEVFSRATREDRWRSRGKQTFYRVSVDGTQVDSAAATFVATADRHWRMTATTGDLPASDQLRIGWVPHELVFVVQGDAPFYLAYGRAGLAPVAWPLKDLVRRLDGEIDLDELPAAILADPVDTGGRDRLKPAPKALDWQAVSLWSVLVLGVALVAWLAIRLVRRQASGD